MSNFFTKGVALVLIIGSILIAVLFILTAASSFSPTGKSPVLVANEPVGDIVMTPDAKYLAAAGSGGVVLLNARTGSVLWKRPISGMTFSSISISSNAAYIVAGAYQVSGGPAHALENGAVYLFNNSGSLLWSIRTGSSPVFKVLVSSNGSRVVAEYSSGVLYLDNRGETLWNYTPPDGGQSLGVAMSQDGSYVAVVDSFIPLPNNPNHGSALILLGSNGKQVWNYTNGSFGESASSVSMTSDGSYVVAGSGVSGFNGSVYYFARNGTLLWARQADSDILAVQVCSNGSCVSAGTNWAVLFYDNKGDLVSNQSLPGGFPQFSADGSRVLVTLAYNSGRTLFLFDNRGNEEWSYTAGPTVGAISGNGSYVAATAGPGLLFFDSNSNGNAIESLAGFLYVVAGGEFFWFFEFSSGVVILGVAVALSAIVFRNHAKQRGERGKVSLKRAKVMALAIIALILVVFFVPTVPTANYTVCHGASCENVTQFSSISDYAFCFGAKYATNIDYWFETACFYG